MEDLVVVTYKNQYSALDNVRTLRKLDDGWVVDIHDAVAVARNSYGKLYLQESYKPINQVGAGWGVLLGGLALVPRTGWVSAVAAAGSTVVSLGAPGDAAFGGTSAGLASWDKHAGGVTEEFVSTVSGTIKRGQSAIFALVESYDPDRVLEHFRGTGGTVIRRSFARSSPFTSRSAWVIQKGDRQWKI